MAVWAPRLAAPPYPCELSSGVRQVSLRRLGAHPGREWLGAYLDALQVGRGGAGAACEAASLSGLCCLAVPRAPPHVRGGRLCGAHQARDEVLSAAAAAEAVRAVAGLDRRFLFEWQVRR